MTQKAVSVTFPDGSVVSVMQPAATVGYAVAAKEPDRISLVFACFIAGDDNPAFAFNQAEIDLPKTLGFSWIATSAIWNSSGSGVGLNRYVPVEVERTPEGKITVRTHKLDDATSQLYERLRDIPAVPFEGLNVLNEALNWLKRREQTTAVAADPKLGSAGMM